jgi:hypothetical protein
MKERMILIGLVGCGLAQATEFKREMSTDRPDTTESPVSVEAGGVQIESSLWAFARDKEDGVKTEAWTLGESNVKFGLADNQDIQFVIRPWISETVKAGGVKERAEGFGDLEVRYKYNLWGNDGGTTAMALMPFVSIPTQTEVSTDEWEGGLIVPFSVELCDRVGLGLMAEVDRVWDDEGGDHEWEFMHTAVLGFDLTETIGLYLEYIGIAGPGDYQALASAGFTWGQTENLQWDVGFTAGLNDAAEDFSVFQGVSFRF